jgi:hypothetical protein
LIDRFAQIDACDRFTRTRHRLPQLPANKFLSEIMRLPPAGQQRSSMQLRRRP